MYRLFTQRSQPGFTLIEMMIVIIIIAIIFSFAVPQLARFTGRKKLSVEAAKLAEVLDVARSYASTERVPYAVMIDAAAKEYFYYRPSDVIEGRTPQQCHRGTLYKIDTSVRVTTGTTTVLFTKQGRLSASNDSTITLAGALGQRIDIVVNYRTGKVTEGTIYS